MLGPWYLPHVVVTHVDFEVEDIEVPRRHLASEGHIWRVGGGRGLWCKGDYTSLDLGV